MREQSNTPRNHVTSVDWITATAQRAQELLSSLLPSSIPTDKQIKDTIQTIHDLVDETADFDNQEIISKLETLWFLYQEELNETNNTFMHWSKTIQQKEVRKEEIKQVLRKIELLQEEFYDQPFNKETFRAKRGVFYAEVAENQPTPKKKQEAVT